MLTSPLLIGHIATAMLPLNNEQFKQKYTNLCFNRYYETPSKLDEITLLLLYAPYFMYFCSQIISA